MKNTPVDPRNVGALTAEEEAAKAAKEAKKKEQSPGKRVQNKRRKK